MNRIKPAPPPRAAAKADAPDPAAGPGAPLGRELLAFSGLAALTLATFSLIFPPWDVWPLALVCLTPWTFAVCVARRPWVAYWLTFVLGWLFFLINLLWLRPVTGLGFVALAFYLGAYWPLSAFAIRTGLRHRIPPVWTLPVVWTACEFVRAWFMSGFPWLFIGHAFHGQLWLIQISDLTGAYGVSFLALFVNGALVTVLCARVRPHPVLALPRRHWVALGIVIAGAFAAAVVYSLHRLGQAGQFVAGPRVAVVQEDFPLVSTWPYGEPLQVSFSRYLAVAAQAAATEPDLLVFPETAWGARQNLSFIENEHGPIEGIGEGARPYGRLSHQATAAFARGEYAAVNEVIARLEASLRNRKLPRIPENGPPVTVVVGSIAVETFPEASYPKFKQYNSALVYDPDGRQRPARYDKNHLVPFGEIVPFRYGRLHFLYRRLNALSPFSDKGRYEYSLTPGGELTVFELATGGRTWRFGTPICYEDVMPYIIRRFVWDGPRRRVDFLVNMSNDGWFQYSAELPQHLAICVFRAVENRVGFARAVNTGISGFIDPNGRVYSVVEQSGRRYGPGTTGFRVDHVRVDRRTSFYGRFGDWFAGLCLLGAAALWIVGVWARWLTAMWRWLARRWATGEA